MPHTLVTGANGFVAAHVISELISEGHTVTGAVRRAAAGEDLLKEFPQWKEKLDFAVIDDYANEDALEKLFQGRDFDYIVHTAAPMPSQEAVSDFDKNFLQPAVEGNMTLLKTAKAYAKNLRSIAITGSINAITMGNPEDNAARSYTNEMYNNITPDYARESESAFVMYCSSKREAELAIWDFMKKEKPHFTVTIFLPALIFGPPLQSMPDLQHLNFSVNVVYNFFNGSIPEVPQTHAAGLFPSYIDARDLATAHVRALTTPGAANKRFLIGGAPLTTSFLVKTLEGLSETEYPELKGRLPKDTGNDVNLSLARIGAEEGNEVLGMKFRSAEETFGDLVGKVLELEKIKGKAAGDAKLGV